MARLSRRSLQDERPIASQFLTSVVSVCSVVEILILSTPAIDWLISHFSQCRS